MTPQERIKADAVVLPDDILSEINNEAEKAAEYFSSTEDAWKAGAIYSELKYHNSSRTQALLDALSDIASGKVLPQFIASMALEQWKSGKGKEVENPCPHCGKELFRDRNLCCRACGKEVTDE